MSDTSVKLVDWAIKIAAALAPVLLATLITIGWNNSHRIAVLSRDVEALDKDVVHLQELFEKQLMR